MSEDRMTTWPSPGAIAISLPEGVSLEPLARAEVPALIAALPVWCPDLDVSDLAVLDRPFGHVTINQCLFAIEGSADEDA